MTSTALSPFGPGPILELTGSYVPVPGDRFQIISGATSGAFRDLPWGSVIWFNGAPLKITYEEGALLAYAAHDVTASVSGNGTVAPAPNSHFVGIGGTCAGSLAAQGVPGVLVNPRLQLFTGSTAIAANDDWAQASNAGDVLASGFAPSTAAESAILVTLQPGAYTAIVTGVDGATGVAIVEVFRNQ